MSYLTQRTKLAVFAALFSTGFYSMPCEPALSVKILPKEALYTFTFLQYANSNIPLNDVAISPGGQKFALSTSKENKAVLGHVETGALKQEYTGHRDLTTTVRFSPNGRFLCTGSNDNTARLYKITTQQPKRFIQELTGHTNSITSIRFSPDGNTLITAAKDGTARLWDTKTGNSLLVIQADNNPLLFAEISPDGEILATSSFNPAETVLSLWSVKTGALIQELKGHKAPISAVAFGTNKRGIITSSWDSKVFVWDMQTGEALFELQTNGGPLCALALHPDGKGFITSTNDGTICVWDTETGRKVQELGKKIRWFNSLGFNKNGSILFIASSLGEVTFFSCVPIE